MQLDETFHVKDNKCLEDLRLIKPTLLKAFAEVVEYTYLHNIPLVITRVVDERIEGVSVSDTHEEGRAIDISVKNLTEEQIFDMRDYFNVKFYNIGAISLKTGESNFMVYEESTDKKTEHIHIQIRPNI